jgi:hypothetical protein
LAEEIKPQIQASEVEAWENRFRENVSPLVQFDKVEGTNTSFKFYKGVSGIEVEWSGIIKLGSDEYIKWKFSILNDVFIDAKYRLNEDNKDIITNVYNLYASWTKEWSQTVSKLGSSPNPLQEGRTKENILMYQKGRMTKLAGLS